MSNFEKKRIIHAQEKIPRIISIVLRIKIIKLAEIQVLPERLRNGSGRVYNKNDLFYISLT